MKKNGKLIKIKVKIKGSLTQYTETEKHHTETEEYLADGFNFEVYEGYKTRLSDDFGWKFLVKRFYIDGISGSTFTRKKKEIFDSFLKRVAVEIKKVLEKKVLDYILKDHERFGVKKEELEFVDFEFCLSYFKREKIDKLCLSI